jgi:uroporphyrinogen decarboxylase
MNPRERILSAAKCRAVDRPPLWVMRQAGRFLPEYRAVRAKHSFAEMVHAPELAAEVTLQPVRRFGFDAAIVFSDILAVPEAMGLAYELRDEGGIRMERAIESMDEVCALSSDTDLLRARLGYVAQALQIVKAALGGETALLGFAGSPWTLCCYMAEGGGASGGAFTKALRMADEAPETFARLMEKLSDAVAAHLALQIEAGADAVQIFDSWAGACPPERYETLSLQWIRRVIEKLPQEAPVILFAKGMSGHAKEQATTGACVLSVGHNTDMRAVADLLPAHIAMQGNLPPSLLEGPPEAVRRATTALLETMRHRNGYIANLGHGITPQARMDSVEALVETVKNFR